MQERWNARSGAAVPERLFALQVEPNVDVWVGTEVLAADNHGIAGPLGGLGGLGEGRRNDGSGECRNSDERLHVRSPLLSFGAAHVLRTRRCCNAQICERPGAPS